MLAPDAVCPARSRVDPQSALVCSVDGHYEVVHAGTNAVVLRPLSGVDDDLVVTTASLGLMPGGLHCSPPAFEHWRSYRLGSAVWLAGQAWSVRDADRVDLHLGSIAVDVEAVRLGEALHREATAEDCGNSIDVAMGVAFYALAREMLDLEIAVLQLIGAGPGSTPAGDDILVGVAAALACTGYPYHSRLIASVARTIEGRTTRASRLYLRAAADGRFAERVHRLAHGMTSVDEITSVMSAVRTWGATSGLDLAAGMLGGLAVVIGQRSCDGQRSTA